MHYRNQTKKILKQYDDGIVKELAYCADKDYPLEALKIPPDFPDFDKA